MWACLFKGNPHSFQYVISAIPVTLCFYISSGRKCMYRNGGSLIGMVKMSCDCVCDLFSMDGGKNPSEIQRGIRSELEDYRNLI